MGVVSKEILEKLRQLSDLLIVIKDSGTTPQILKELAVEKCAEIYNALTEQSKGCNAIITESEERASNDELEGVAISTEDENEVCTQLIEEVTKEESQVEDDKPSFEVEEEDLNIAEEENDEEDFQLTSNTESQEEYQSEEDNDLIENFEPIFDEQPSEDEQPAEDDTEEEPIPDDVVVSEEELINEVEEWESKFDNNDDSDLFAPLSQSEVKRCNHTKIRSILSINDKFLYKRELFGNSDVDMTDIFDGVDEALTFDDAMELLSEYFGEDIETEELVKEFVERVKQCFN